MEPLSWQHSDDMFVMVLLKGLTGLTGQVTDTKVFIGRSRPLAAILESPWAAILGKQDEAPKRNEWGEIRNSTLDGQIYIT